MFSVKDFMEEGFKFIIPPPKYHPFPNILPVIEPSFLSEKMAADTPYHHLPEDNRPSMDTIPGDDQPLLGTDPISDNDETPPKKEHNIKISCHPTFHIRLLVLCLYIIAFAVLGASKYNRVIPVMIFLAVAVTRILVVLFFHLVGHCFVRIRIELVGRTRTTRNPKPVVQRPTWTTQHWTQIAIDWLIIVLVLITAVVASTHQRSYGWRYSSKTSKLVEAGTILCFFAMWVVPSNSGPSATDSF